MNRREFVQLGAFTIAAPQEPGTAKVIAWKSASDASELFTYAPREDITLYELAALMPVFAMANSFGRWEYFSETIKKDPNLIRHFKKA